MTLQSSSPAQCCASCTLIFGLSSTLLFQLCPAEVMGSPNWLVVRLMTPFLCLAFYEPSRHVISAPVTTCCGGELLRFPLRALIRPPKWLSFGGHQTRHIKSCWEIFQLSKSSEFHLHLSYPLTENVSLAAGTSCAGSQVCRSLVKWIIAEI